MSNTGITLVDVRSQAMDTIKELKAGKLDVKTAREIKGLLDVVIDTAKTQVDFINALPESIKESMNETTIKAIAGTLRDRDAELDESLATIESNKQTYSISSK